MKNVLIVFAFSGLFVIPYSSNTISFPIKTGQAQNLFIITTDGFRWLELYTGADPILINTEKYTPDTATIKALYWTENAAERRKLLMPFFWNIIAAKGQLYGNRYTGNRVNTSNFFSASYPGYNELLTGTTDVRIYRNERKLNPNINLLEFINARDSFAGKVAAFTSWELFPYILNQPRNGLPVNSGYTKIEDSELSAAEINVNTTNDLTRENKSTRHDHLTFMAAKSWLEKNHPRVLYLGLGETDEFAHSSRYDLYLQKAHEADAMIADLWHWVQTTPGYKDNTVFIITTDHGRGTGSSNWNVHGTFINGSSQTWLACLGPGVDALGEIKDEQQIYAKQLPGLMSSILGINFGETSKR